MDVGGFMTGKILPVLILVFCTGTLYSQHYPGQIVRDTSWVLQYPSEVDSMCVERGHYFGEIVWPKDWHYLGGGVPEVLDGEHESWVIEERLYTSDRHCRRCGYPFGTLWITKYVKRIWKRP